MGVGEKGLETNPRRAKEGPGLWSGGGGGGWGENCTWTKTYLLILEGEGPAGPTLPWPPRQSSL